MGGLRCFALLSSEDALDNLVVGDSYRLLKTTDEATVEWLVAD